MAEPFQFKQFKVHQDRCAMKVGTDGVLLGAWTSLELSPQSILDIGAGTGIIALQLAQRSSASVIDALEIDENAYEQCVENFENSPWSDRLFCYHADLEEFTEEIDDTYDLIVANPPFYTEDFQSNDTTRNIARFTDALPFDLLFECVAALLTDRGSFQMIVPIKEEAHCLQLAAEVNLSPKRICHVQGSITTAPIRSLMEFTFQSTTPEITSLVIEINRHEYTSEYKKLVQDFYLKM